MSQPYNGRITLNAAARDPCKFAHEFFDGAAKVYVGPEREFFGTSWIDVSPPPSRQDVYIAGVKMADAHHEIPNPPRDGRSRVPWFSVLADRNNRVVGVRVL